MGGIALVLALSAIAATPTVALDQAADSPRLETELGVWLHLRPSILVGARTTDEPTPPTTLPLGKPDVHPSPDGSWSMVWRASNDVGDYNVEMRGNPRSPVVTVTVQGTSRVKGWLDVEALRFVVNAADSGEPTRLSVMDASYRRRPVYKKIHLGNLTPRRVFLRRGDTQATLEGLRGTQAVTIAKQRDGAYFIDLELDHRGNHPFSAHVACNPRMGMGRPPKVDLSSTPVKPGDERRLTARWLLGAFSPPTVSRYPEGYRSALVLVDHADLSSPARLEALAYGETGALARRELGPDHPGLINQELVYTKSIFLSGAHASFAPQWGNRRFNRLTQRLRNVGVEIALHSPTGVADLTASVHDALDAYPHRLHTWVDHQPSTNCEALSAAGWKPESPYFVLGELEAQRVRNAWAGYHLESADDGLNLLLSSPHQRRRPVVFSHGLLPGLRLIASENLFVDRAEFVRRFSPEALAELSRTRGLSLAHVYLENADGGKYTERALLEQIEPQTYRLFPEVNDVFVRLGEAHRSKRIWVTTVQQLVEHLEASRNVRTFYPSPDTVELFSDVDVAGLALITPARATGAVHAGTGRRLRKFGNTVWVDLTGNKATRIQFVDRRGVPVQLRSSGNAALQQSRVANLKRVPAP